MKLLRRIPAPVWLLAPALLFVAAMALFPLGSALVLSFRQWRLTKSTEPGPFVGLENYVLLFTDDPEFLESIRARGTKIELAWAEAKTLRLDIVKRADLIR